MISSTPSLFTPPWPQALPEIPPQRHRAKGVFQIHPPVSVVDFLNNISISQVRVTIKETEHGTTFEISIKTFRIKTSIIL